MTEIAIRIEHIGKQYFIGAHKMKRNFREAVVNAVYTPFRRAGKLLRGQASGAAELDETIWALKDVSFDVKRGDVVGIIGRNGSGKSTLLKIISRITEPTKGVAQVLGRVGSLLEVGTGFHPELTGRENIFLNGAILGMKKEQISRQFDEIVAFSEIEKFIDTPVKHYSSGMYMRLAFAVAAHLEPEILLIDEVLAVGDVAFQKKCLGKMSNVAKEGRTILFVSHNMAAIANLCNKAVLLQDGRVEMEGETKRIIDRYVSGVNTIAKTLLADRKDRKGIGNIRAMAFELLNHENNITQHAISGQELTIRMHYKTFEQKEFKNCRASVTVTKNEQVYFCLSTELVDVNQLDLTGEGWIDFIIPEFPLSQSSYILHSYIEGNKEIQDWVIDAAELSVIDGDYYGTGRNYPSEWQGGVGVLIKFFWKNTEKSLSLRPREGSGRLS
jgi:lipopolysaccharide transport system ATP-binding protein